MESNRMTVSSPQEIEDALYLDDSGEVVGLDEVQLLENPSLARVRTLESAFRGDDIELLYRAALVLSAWGNDKGLDAIERLVDSNVDRMGVNVPHRIYGYNNIYDEIANAVFLFGHSNGHRPSDKKRIYSKLLALYGPYDFESKIKHALLASDVRGLLPELQRAFERALELAKPYLASQLLPIITKNTPEEGWRLICLLLSRVTGETPNPLVNVAEALAHVESQNSVALLRQLCQYPDSVVAAEAGRSLSILHG